MCRMLLTKCDIRKSPMQYGGKETKIVRVGKDLTMVFDRLPLQTKLGDNKCSPIRTNTGWLMYVGEIFNYNRTMFESDVDLVVEMFNSMSPADVARESAWWDGFWAVCFLEEDTGRLYCWTDPLGKKQLYYSAVNKGVSLPDVCSEIRPLVNHFANFDRFYRAEVFKWGYNTDDRTPWECVKRVMPNKLYEFSEQGDVRIHDKPLMDWYNPVWDNPRDLYGLMMQAVNDRLITTGSKVGMMLSGGLDSSIIAAILKELEADVDLYTVNNGDDYEYAHLMADYLGLPLTDLEYNMDDGTFMETCFRTNETPIDLGSVVPNQAMFQRIPTDVVLSGDGADELFGGYRRIDDYDSQLSDVFQELTFYHLPRLDRACSRYTKELRNPFLSHYVIPYALRIPYEQRKHKKILKDTFGYMLPKEIVDRPKLPLKNDELKKDPMAYRKKIHNMFYNKNFWHENL